MSPKLRRPGLRRPDVRRAAGPWLPNGFTLANLGFGIYAIISASRGNYDIAVRCIVYGGVADLFDGAVARATRTGTELGEQLDSLVDAVSFGLAPAMIVYYAVLQQQGWGWLPVFIYAASAVFRLARFNVTQAGAAKSYFIGLPSPAAGGTLATYYWFTQTHLYQDTRIVDLPWQEIMPTLMLLLAMMMSSTVPYPAWPKVGVRSWRAVAGLLGVLAIVTGAIFFTKYFFFLFGVGYLAYGLLRALLLAAVDFPGGANPRRRASDYVDPMEAYGSPPIEVVRAHAAPRPAFDAEDDGAPDTERRQRPTPGGATAAERDETARRRRRRRRKGGGPGGGPPGPAGPAEHGPGTPPE